MPRHAQELIGPQSLWNQHPSTIAHVLIVAERLSTVNRPKCHDVYEPVNLKPQAAGAGTQQHGLLNPSHHASKRAPARAATNNGLRGRGTLVTACVAGERW